MYSFKRISKNVLDITLTRGDSLLATVEMFDIDGQIYAPTEGDSVRFAMKRNYSDVVCVIEKNIPIDTLLLEIAPEDTKPLPMGTDYVYDIQLTTALGKVDTFLKGRFKLDSEVK